MQGHDQANSVGEFLKLLAIFFMVVPASIGSTQRFEIQDALRNALDNRKAVQAAKLRLEQAKLACRTIRAQPASQLLIGYSNEPAAGGSDDDLVLAGPMDLFGRLSTAKRIGKATLAEAEASYRQALLEIQSEVFDAYVHAASARELARASGELQALLEQLHDVVRRRVEGGVMSGYQLSRVGLDLEQARLRNIQRTNDAQVALRRLEALTGRTDLELAAIEFPKVLIEKFDLELLPFQTPELMLLAAQVHFAEAEVEQARNSGRPSFEVQLRRTPWQERDERFGMRLQLSIPVFDRGRVASETQAAKKQLEAAQKLLADAIALAQGEVRNLQAELEAAKGQVAGYELLVAKAKELENRLRPGLTERATTLVEVLDATRTLKDLEQMLIEARTRQAVTQARLIRAAGNLLAVNP